MLVVMMMTSVALRRISAGFMTASSIMTRTFNSGTINQQDTETRSLLPLYTAELTMVSGPPSRVPFKVLLCRSDEAMKS
ncbi:hypothetical protein QE152_g39087 [Popillia japonica]|uniref:Secreted protein n=1 Tax=Popillia japonica TaxID=7064 RepID=A0AAW1HUV0_POPJA